VPALFFLMVVVGGSFWWFENPDLQEQAKDVAWVVAGCAAIYWAYRKVHLRFRLARHGRLLERLRSFAAGLTGGQFSAPGFFEGGTAKVTGTYDGLRLQLEASFGDNDYIAYELTGIDSLVEFDAAPASFLTKLFTERSIRYDVPLVERRGGPELALRRLLGDLGLNRVCMTHGVLRGMGPASELRLSPDQVFTVFRELGRVARVFAKPKPKPSARSSERRLATRYPSPSSRARRSA
jgi:hypothetical protein